MIPLHDALHPYWGPLELPGLLDANSILLRLADYTHRVSHVRSETSAWPRSGVRIFSNQSPIVEARTCAPQSLARRAVQLAARLLYYGRIYYRYFDPGKKGGKVAGGAKADSRALFHNESVAKVEHDGFFLVENGLVEVTTVDAVYEELWGSRLR